jgi:hypothetical protein
VESDDLAASSSSNIIVVKMVNKTTLEMPDYWKKLIVTEADRSAYHATNWLGGRLVSLVPTVEVPTVDNTIVVCFESHLVAGLGLNPSKFLVAITNFLGCELVHLNLNAIAAPSWFIMMCECRLRIAIDTNPFCYFYSPAHYDKVVYFGIRLSLCHHRRKEYINATFKSS